MHGMGVEKGNIRIPSKEGARPGVEEGGIKNADIKESDISDQRIWTFVKMRLYMTGDDWDNYLNSIQIDKGLKQKAHDRFKDYFMSLTKQIASSNAAKKDYWQHINKAKTGIEQLGEIAEYIVGKIGDSVEKEQAMIGGSNRIYEEKLKSVSELRQKIKVQTDRINSKSVKGEELEQLESQLQNNLAVLRGMLSEASLYANEAYVTDAAVNHAVVGLQIGKKITQTKNECIDAMNENLADACKELRRHSPDGIDSQNSLGEAAYKAGKYIMRMADAAQNIGITVPLSMELLYLLGKEISEKIKNDNNIENKKLASKEAVGKFLSGDNIDTPTRLIDMLMNSCAGVMENFNELTDKNAPAKSSVQKPKD